MESQYLRVSGLACLASHIACSEAQLRPRTSSRMHGCVGRAQIEVQSQIRLHSLRLRRRVWQSPSHSQHDLDAKLISGHGCQNRWTPRGIRASAPNGPKLWSLPSCCYSRNSLRPNAPHMFCEKRLTIPTIRLPTPFDRPQQMLDNWLPARANTLVMDVASLLARANNDAFSRPLSRPHRKAIFMAWKNSLHRTLFPTPTVAEPYT